MLNICFLGKVKIEYNEKNIEEKLGSKAIALICLLTLNTRRYVSREKLEGYLWPDSDTEAARYNLRYNLWLIKKNIGKDEKGREFFYVDNECCSINKDYQYECDILSIMNFETSSKDTIQKVLDLKFLFRGDLLEGYYFKNCDEFNDLIIFERMKFDQHKIRVLKRLVELYGKENDHENCLLLIDEVLEMEPFDEDMVLKVLNIYVKLEKPVAAISYYNDFNDVLANGLGVFPSQKLRTRYIEIRSSLKHHNIMGEQASKFDKVEQDNRNKEINLTSYCIKNIEYFWISDVIGKIIDFAGFYCLDQLNEKEIYDLGHIQGDILNRYNKQNKQRDMVDYLYKHEVMDVGIINAFIKLINCIGNNYNFTITILNSIDMDDTSAGVLEYLKRTKPKGLKLVEE